MTLPSAAPTRCRRGAVAAHAQGWPSPSCRRSPSGCPAPWRAACIETGWSAGAMTLVRVGLAAAALTPFGLAALRGRWGAAAPQRRPPRSPTARSRSRAPSSATSPRSSTCRSVRRSSSSSPRPPWSWRSCGCGTAQRPGRMTLAGAGAGRARPGAGARPGLRRRPEPPGGAVGAGRDGRLRDVLHHQRGRGQRSPAAGPGLGRAGRRCAGARAARGRRGAADARRRPPRRRTPTCRSPGGSRWWCWAWSPPRWPTSPASPRAAGSARGWRPSWRCSRWSSSVAGPGCCCDELPGAVQLVGGLLILAGVVAVKLGEPDR